MKVVRLHIDGFGRFADHAVGPLNAPITIFFGANEAGKTTYLEFFRTVLFGFRSRAGRQPRDGRRNDYPPLAGGNHGGRITVETASGSRYMIDRRQGSGAGPVVVTNEAGEALDSGMLTRILGNHSRDVFEQVFAFTLDELHSSALLSDESVNAQIYSAGTGASALPGALSSLESRRSELFLNRGSTQSIYLVANEIDGLDTRLRDISGNAARYAAVAQRLQQLDTRHGLLMEQRRAVDLRRARQQALQSAWEDWIELVSSEAGLSDLPKILNFPAGGVRRLDALKNAVSTARSELEGAEDLVEQAKSAAGVEIELRDILDHSDRVSRLMRGRSAYDSSVHDLPDRRQELAGHRSALESTLEDLGPDWDQDRLNSFNLPIETRQKIEQFRGSLTSASENLTELRRQEQQARTSFNEASEEAERRRKQLERLATPELDTDQIAERRTAKRTAQSVLIEIRPAADRVEDLQIQLAGHSEGRPRRSTSGRTWTLLIATTSILAGIALIAAGMAFSDGVVVLELAAGALLVVLGIYLLLTTRRPGGGGAASATTHGVESTLAAAQTRLGELQESLAEQAGYLGLETPDQSAIIAAEALIDRQQTDLVEWNRTSEAVASAAALMERRRRALAKLQEARSNADRMLNREQREWKSWLAQRGLRDTYTPETVEQLREALELGRTLLGNVRSWEERIRAIERNIEEYVAVAAPLARMFSMELDSENRPAVAAAADSVIEMHGAVVEAVNKQEAAEDELVRANDNLARRRSGLTTAEAELQTLLEAGDASEAEEFRRRAEIFGKRSELSAQIHRALGRLQRLSGPGEPLERLRKDLAETDAQAIAIAIAEIEEVRTNVDSAIEELAAERREVEIELTALSSEEDSSALRMERNILAEQIREQAREWTRLTVARNLITEARLRFERERQPGVVRHAETFFRQITAGRYRTVFAPLGEQTITVTDRDGRTKQPTELSRGTREQLFLALRFGLVKELGERAQPLPVVVDEVLVNFDPDRALRAAASFVELSQTNQVLVFTCHPQTVETFREAARLADAETPEIVDDFTA